MGTATANIRNVAIAGHGSTGKTTLLEQLLFSTGVTSKFETVDSGRTVSDYTEEEIEKKMSIHLSLAHTLWKGIKINFIDTPGSGDFVGETVGALRIAETAVVLVGAKASVQIETIKLWRRLEDRNLPRIVFVNKMDRDNANFMHVLEDLNDRFHQRFIPITIPIGSAENYKGIVHLIDNKAIMVPKEGEKEVEVEVPADMKAIVEEFRLKLIEAAAEGDDELMEKYFEQGNLSHEEIVRGLRTGLKNNKLVPLLCGAALKNSGLMALLDFIAEDAPTPAITMEHGTDKNDKEIEIAIGSAHPTSAFIYKTYNDQFAGRLSYVKVVTGRLVHDMEFFHPEEGKKERIGKMYICEGKKLIEVSELESGDIGVLSKVVCLSTNNSICAVDDIIHFKPLMLPQPTFSLAITASNKKEEDKLNQLLHKQAEEDLTFKLDFNAETKETVISGMGELHVNTILERITTKQKIQIETKIPKIAYRETITKSSGAEFTHKKQTGGHGQYAKVVLDIKPLPRGENFKFVNAIHGGSIPKNYIPAVEKGLVEGMLSGVLAGYPMVDIEASVIDGKEHAVDSSELAFKLATRGALKDAVAKAGPVLLEPVMNLEVISEDKYMGDILSDLSSKRGKVQGQDILGTGFVSIKAQVPHGELLRYAIDLRSITAGTASFELNFDHYSPVSGRQADTIIAEAKQHMTAEE